MSVWESIVAYLFLAFLAIITRAMYLKDQKAWEERNASLDLPLKPQVDVWNGSEEPEETAGGLEETTGGTEWAQAGQYAWEKFNT